MSVQTLEKVKRNIAMILRNQPQGEVQVEYLEEMYSRRFHQELEWRPNGFSSLREMLNSMERYFEIKNGFVRLLNFENGAQNTFSNNSSENSNSNGLDVNRAFRGFQPSNFGRFVRRPPRSNIYSTNNWVLKVNNFPEDTEQGELEELFRPYDFVQVVIRKDVPEMFALVEIEDYEVATNAFAFLDGSDFLGGKLSIQFDRSSIARNQDFTERGRRRGDSRRGGGYSRPGERSGFNRFQGHPMYDDDRGFDEGIEHNMRGGFPRNSRRDRGDQGHRYGGQGRWPVREPTTFPKSQFLQGRELGEACRGGYYRDIAASEKVDEKPPLNINDEKPLLNRNDEKPPLNRNDGKPLLNRNYEKPPLNRNDEKPPLNRNDEKPLLNRNDEKPPLNRNENPLLNRNYGKPFLYRNDVEPFSNKNSEKPPSNRNDENPFSNRKDDKRPSSGNHGKPFPKSDCGNHFLKRDCENPFPKGNNEKYYLCKKDKISSNGRQEQQMDNSMGEGYLDKKGRSDIETSVTDLKEENIEKKSDDTAAKKVIIKKDSRLDSICMNPDQIEQMICDTGLPSLRDTVSELPAEELVLVIYDISYNYFWAIVMNCGKWSEEHLELEENMRALEDQSLIPAQETSRKVCKLFEGAWCRAWVAEEITEETVRLFYVDYGITEEASRKQLYKLPEHIWKFRFMAIPFYVDDYKFDQMCASANAIPCCDPYQFDFVTCLDKLKKVES